MDRVHDIHNSSDCTLKGIQTLTNYEQTSPSFEIKKKKLWTHHKTLVQQRKHNLF